LTIPKDAGKFQGERALKPHPADYTVRSGDTIYSIACQFGDVWPEAIAQVNGFDIDDPLPVGETIKIP
jgi:LysM repeat protein